MTTTHFTVAPVMVENEIHFLSWTEFKQRAPSILRLEARRIGMLIGALPVDAAFRNALVKARFELKHFIACLRQADKASVEACAVHLHTAMLLLSMQQAHVEKDAAQTLNAITERLTYLYDRMRRIY